MGNRRPLFGLADTESIVVVACRLGFYFFYFCPPESFPSKSHLQFVNQSSTAEMWLVLRFVSQLALIRLIISSSSLDWNISVNISVLVGFSRAPFPCLFSYYSAHTASSLKHFSPIFHYVINNNN